MQWLKGGTGYTEDAAIALPKFTRTSWIINAVDGMQLYGAVNSKSLTMWKQNGVGRLPEQRSHLGCTKQLSWMNSILPATAGAEPIVQALLQTPLQVIIRSLPNPPAYFDLAGVHSEVFCHKHYADGVELKRGVDF